MDMKKYFIFSIFYIFFIVSCLYGSTEIGSIKNLKYVIYNMPQSDINAINVLVRAGSIYDPKGKFGLAYTVARLLRQGGTKSYKTDELFNRLDETGIELSTGCGKDFISINMKFIKRETSSALKIFKEILFSPAFNKKEFFSVKKEILSTIVSYQNNYDYVALHNGALNILKNTEYSHTSFGTIKGINNIVLEDVKKFYKKYFVPENMIITFSGSFNNNQIKAFLKNNIKKLNNKYKLHEIFPVYKKRGKRIFKEKDIKQSYIYILFPSFGLKSKEYYPLKILSFTLGGNLTSLLAEKIRKELGLAYSVFATNYSMVNGGFFIIGMQTENSKRELAIKNVLNVLKLLKENGISEDKIKLSKDFLTGAIPISLQSTVNIASSISKGIFLNKPIPPWEYDINRINSVKKKDIDKVIKEIFDLNRMVISIVGKK